MSEWWTYRLSDFLMFSPRTYWRLIENYNQAIWPAQVVALAAGLVLLWLAADWRARHLARARHVDAVQVRDQPFHAVGKRFVGHRHVGEERVAADLGDRNSAQERAERWMRGERHVRMPLAPRVAAFAGRAVGVRRIGDHQQLRIFRMAVAGQRVVAVELPEAPAELDVLLARAPLVAQQQDAVSQERTIDLAELRLGHRLRDVDIAHLGAQRIR